MKEVLFLLIGVAATLLVSRYYFRRSVAKSLTPFLHFSTSLFRDIAPEVRQALKIEYAGTRIEDLMEVQFLIANTGERAIHDVIEPLTVEIPQDCFVVDATLLHTNPAERRIILQKTEKSVRFEFPLLNQREFFLVRLLLRGEALPNRFSFTITAEDLPPRLAITPLPFDAIGTPDDKRFEWSGVVAALVIAVLASAVGFVAYNGWRSTPRPYEGWLRLCPAMSWHTACIAGTSLVAVILILIAMLVALASFGGGSFPPRKKLFILPRDLMRRRIPSMAAANLNSPPTSVYREDR